MDRHSDQQPRDLNTNPQPGNSRYVRHSTDPLLGQQMGSYRLIRPLGSGGGAVIYLGEHTLVPATHAAIKIPKEKFNPKEIQHFCDEASTLFLMIHPHITRVLDFGVEGVTPYLVLDYAPRGTLRESHPRGQRVPLEDIISYVNQIASALQYAHDQRIIHRDIKPENLLLGRSGEVLLTDFGIAIRAHSTISQSEQHIGGTVTYMAPEQCMGKACPASDQYALGILVYEWLCGQPPFQGDTSLEVAMQHGMKTPPLLHTLLPEVFPAVEQVVHRALAKTPEERFPTVQAFAEALEWAALEEASLSASPPLAAPSVSSQEPVPVAPAPAQQQAPKRRSLWNSTYWLRLGVSMLVTGVVAILLAGTATLSPGLIIGGLLMGLGILVVWVSTRFA
jgi:serine/threonine protein kinase